jgi:hypothetical protein
MRSDFDYTQSRRTRGSFFCLKHGNSAMMLASFPNSLYPLDRVVANLLDEFLLGAMATFRVTAPRAVSTT